VAALAIPDRAALIFSAYCNGTRDDFQPPAWVIAARLFSVWSGCSCLYASLSCSLSVRPLVAFATMLLTPVFARHRRPRGATQENHQTIYRGDSSHRRSRYLLTRPNLAKRYTHSWILWPPGEQLPIAKQNGW
jgi:hypothetical protein